MTFFRFELMAPAGISSQQHSRRENLAQCTRLTAMPYARWFDSLFFLCDVRCAFSFSMVRVLLLYGAVAGDHSKQDQMLVVKIAKYIGSGVYRRSYLNVVPRNTVRTGVFLFFPLPSRDTGAFPGTHRQEYGDTGC